MRFVCLLFICVIVATATADQRNRRNRHDTVRKRSTFSDLFELDDSSNEGEDGLANDGSDEDSFPLPDFDFDSLIGAAAGGEENVGQVGQRAKGFFSNVWNSIFNGIEQGEDEESSHENPTSGSGRNSLLNFLNEMRPWWKGANVCSREENEVEKAEQLDSSEGGESSLSERTRIRSIINGLSTSCADLGDVYKCTVRVTRGGKTKVKTLIYECCHGYAREDGQKGCTKEEELTDLKSTLENMNLTRFMEAAERIGMDDLITEGKNYTYFVPKNAAWETLTDSEQFKVIVVKTEDKDELTKDIIMAHVLPGWQYSYDWFDEMVVNSTEPDNPIRLNLFNNPRPFWTANCARITSTNHKATNAIIHQVDDVLMPADGTLWDQLSQDQQFSKFSSLIDRKLQDKLMDSNEHLTVLAFTDNAFNRLSETMRQSIIDGNKCFKDLISEHIFPHTICSAAVNSNVTIRNILDHPIKASRTPPKNNEDGEMMFEDIPVSATDRMATNGVLHIIDGIIILESMLDTMEVLKRRDAINFANLLIENNLNVQNYPEVTLFVPPERSLQDLTNEDKKKTLEMHIVADIRDVKSIRDLRDFGRRNESVVLTQSGEELTLSACSGLQQFPFSDFSVINAHIGCSQIVAPNVRTCNGIIHFIDKPLMYAKLSVLDLLKSRSDLSEFVNMLEKSSVLKTINEDDFDGTVLAPTNTALESAFNANQKKTLVNDKKKLDAFMKRHIIREKLCEYELRDSASPFTLQRHQSLGGESVNGRHVRGKFQINGASVAESDIQATNGILYVLEQPIMRRRQSSLWDIFGFGA